MADSLLIAIVDDMVAALGQMSKANGFEMDYTDEILQASQAHTSRAVEGDVVQVHFDWLGTVPQSELTGDDTRANQQEHLERFLVSAIVPTGTEARFKKAFRVRQDWHRALMDVDTSLGLDRHRAQAQANFVRTYEIQSNWERQDEAGQPIEGLLEVEYQITWRHTTGDMTT